MNYCLFKGSRLSTLGFGTMKLPVIDGISRNIDEDRLEEMVDYAMNHGINYYDTAWGYHDGKAAAALGKALEKYSREKYFLANKFPGYNAELMKKPEEIFEKQLKDCRTDYFDFYLMHDVDDNNIDAYTDPETSAVNFFLEKKKEGKIRHLGFSSYGSVETINRFLDTYKEDMEFCQITLNYMQWAMKNVKERVECLKKREIPIWAMGALDRGHLVEMTDDRKTLLKIMRPNESVAGWAYGFVQSVTTVKTVVSDMSEMKHLKENIKIFSGEKHYLNSKEGAVLMGIAEDILGDKK